VASVFLSYDREDSGRARHFARALEKAGHAVWWDLHIKTGAQYTKEIDRALKEAEAVVVLWSERSVESAWVRDEAAAGRDSGRLVPVALDRTEPPLGFRQFQTIDLSRWNGRGKPAQLQTLLTDVAAMARTETGAAAEHGSMERIASRQSTNPTTQPLPRRTAILAGGAAALIAAAAGGMFASRKVARTKASPQAELLVQKAQAIMQDGRPGEQGQAIAYIQEATRIAPQFAQAWGLLAVNYALRKFQVPKNARAGEEVRCRSAARTALDLDRDEPFASCALVLLVPSYRNWSQVESLGRDLAGRFTFLPLADHILSDLLADVGRWREAVEVQSKIDRKNFLIPLSERAIIQALWSNGEIQRAETLLDEAAKRWPQHEAIWNLRVNFLMHTGRADEAARLLEDRSMHPPGYSQELLGSSLLTARAISGSTDRESAIASNLEMLRGEGLEFLTYLNHKISTAQLVAGRCAALGAWDTAFQILEGYYFGVGRWAHVTPPTGNDDRSTVTLFEPPMSSLRRDARFTRLTERIGLDRYWRETSTLPDYRRPS
jgi:Flp pilus assembly protein TadD